MRTDKQLRSFHSSKKLYSNKNVELIDNDQKPILNDNDSLEKY